MSQIDRQPNISLLPRRSEHTVGRREEPVEILANQLEVAAVRLQNDDENLVGVRQRPRFGRESR